MRVPADMRAEQSIPVSVSVVLQFSGTDWRNREDILAFVEGIRGDRSIYKSPDAGAKFFPSYSMTGMPTANLLVILEGIDIHDADGDGLISRFPLFQVSQNGAAVQIDWPS